MILTIIFISVLIVTYVEKVSPQSHTSKVTWRRTSMKNLTFVPSAMLDSNVATTSTSIFVISTKNDDLKFLMC